MKPNSNDPPRVCHISTVHIQTDVRIFVRECGSLAAAGYEVHLVIDAPEEKVINGIHVHPIPRFRSRIARMVVAPWLALRAALQTKSHIYHYHDPELIWLGFVLRWVLQKNVVFDIHESVYRQVSSKKYLPGPLGPLAGTAYRLLERLLTFGQTKIVANAGSVGDYTNPVLVQNYPRPFEIESASTRFEQDAVPLLVYVGAVHELRGSMQYLELARRLAESGRKFEMQIIGRTGTIDLESRMRQKIKQYGLEDCVTIAGRQDWQVAMQTISEATIGLCLLRPVPNYTTCLATKIIEYMMLGTPVLASDFDCWRPYVEGERVGRMVDPLNVDAIYQTCIEMLDDVEELKAMSQRGPVAVREKYTWDQEFQKLDECYQKILGTRP